MARVDLGLKFRGRRLTWCLNDWLDGLVLYQSANVSVPIAFAAPASFSCVRWEAVADSSRGWGPSTPMGEQDWVLS